MTNTYRELKNGVKMPPIGYGTWKLVTGKPTTEAVTAAIKCGYRYIDTAYSYGNDFYVGKAIKNSNISRNDIFVSNKVWNTFQTSASVIDCCKKSLKLMKLDCFDLYLVHWPVAITEDGWKEINREIWFGMEWLYKEGCVRAIGISNFLPHHILALQELNAEVEPMVNQIEFHPGCFNRQTLEFCKERGIVVQGWSPLGSSAVLGNKQICQLAEKYKRSAAQICLRWALQHDIIPIPRSQNPKRMQKNLDVFDFEIDDQDVAQINCLINIGCSEYSPDIYHPE